MLAGAYCLREPREELEAAPLLQIAASGAVMPEVLRAVEELEDEGVAVRVVDVTSNGRLFTGWRDHRAEAVKTCRAPRSTPHVLRVLRRGVPLETVHDASSHAMAWLGAAVTAPSVNLGVDGFGESGSVSELYEKFGLSAGQIVNAALVALEGEL